MTISISADERVCGSGEIGWSYERVERLKSLHAEGKSAKEIASDIGGVTRNAVLGKIHRLGLSSRVNRRPVHRVEHADKGRRRNGGATKEALKAIRAREKKIAALANQSPITNIVLARARAMGELPACEAVELPQGKITRPPVALLDLAHHHCRWPVEEDGKTKFCGADKHTGAYCEWHARIAYRPLIVRHIADAERERMKRLTLKNIQEGKMRKQSFAIAVF